MPSAGPRPVLLADSGRFAQATVPRTAPILLVISRYSSGPLNFAAYSPGIASATEDPVMRASTGPDQRECPAHIGGYGLSGLRQTELQGLTGVHRPFALDRRPWAAQGPRWMDRAPCAEHPVQAELRGDVLQSRRRVRVRRGTVRCARRTVGMPVRLHSAVNAHVRPRAGPVLAAGARVESTLRTRSPRSFPGLTRTRSSASVSSGR